MTVCGRLVFFQRIAVPQWRMVCAVLSALACGVWSSPSIATDITPNAIESVARELQRMPKAPPIELENADLLGTDRGPIDLIVSNPPWMKGEVGRTLDLAMYFLFFLPCTSYRMLLMLADVDCPSSLQRILRGSLIHKRVLTSGVWIDLDVGQAVYNIALDVVGDERHVARLCVGALQNQALAGQQRVLGGEVSGPRVWVCHVDDLFAAFDRPTTGNSRVWLRCASPKPNRDQGQNADPKANTQ